MASSPKPQVRLSPLGAALAGALGGCFSTAIVYPLDVAKTRIQALPTTSSEGKKMTHMNKGMLHVLLRIYAKEGIRGWYRGFGATMINTFSMQYAYFFFYSLVRTSYLKRVSPPSKGKIPAPPVVLSTAMELLLGAIAGALAQIFTIPVSVIATRQQIGKLATSSPAPALDTAEKGESKAGASSSSDSTPAKEDEESFLGVARTIIAEDGYSGLWLGIKPGLVLTVNPAITYGMFERVKNLVLLARPGESMGAGTTFVVGALSKTLATVVTYPYIMAKVRIQARTSDADSGVPAGTHPSAVQILSRVFKQEGFTGWYQGMEAQITKAVLSQALLFASRDVFEKWAAILIALLYTIRKR